MDTPEDDQILLNQLKNDDLSSFEQLYRRYYKVLTYEAFYMLNDRMEAEDEVHALFYDFLKKKKYQDINTSLKSYLHTSIRNRCLNVLKKRKTDRRHLELYTGDKNDFIENDFTERNDLKMQLRDFLQQMPPQRSQAFQLIHIEERKYQEAADEMGLSINSVKTHLKLAVKAIRRRFDNFK